MSLHDYLHTISMPPKPLTVPKVSSTFPTTLLLLLLLLRPMPAGCWKVYSLQVDECLFFP